VRLTIPTKTSFNEATDAHIVVVGSVPETEIVKTLTSADITNGLANRFPMFYSVRTKSVPFPEPTDPGLMESFAGHLVVALREAWAIGEVRLTADARDIWRIIYAQLEEKAHPPAVASLLARQSTYTLIFAALLALLNRKREIDSDHLNAALAWIEYWEDTTLFVFSTGDQNEKALKMRALMDAIVQAITALGGSRVPHSQISNKLTNGYQKVWPTAGVIKEAVELLQRESPPRVFCDNVTTGGRPSLVYSLERPEQ
jgi:hypothetical protein